MNNIMYLAGNIVYLSLWAFLVPRILDNVKAESAGWAVAIGSFVIAGIHLVVFTFLAKAPENAFSLGDYWRDAVNHNWKFFSLAIVLNFLFVISSVIITQKTGFPPAVAIVWEITIMVCFLCIAPIWFKTGLQVSPWLGGCLVAFSVASYCMFMHQKAIAVVNKSDNSLTKLTQTQ